MRYWILALIWYGAMAWAAEPADIELIQIPAGTFQMGTMDIEAVRFEVPEPGALNIDDETPAHRVTISRPFWLGRTEVTQAQWLAAMGTRPGPDDHWQRSDWRTLPVVSVSWHMAQSFIAKLNQSQNHWVYRLPTEAEWEYAARAGSTDLRPFPDEDLSEHAWFIQNSGDRPQPVATRVANAFGLHDMLGNAWEWVADHYAPNTYQRGTRIDPGGPAQGPRRVRRGGSYHCPAHLVRPGYRAADLPSRRYSVLGLRIAADPTQRRPPD